MVVTLAMAAGVAIPRLHPLFADERMMGTTGAQVAHKSLVEMPLGTVLLEEVVFRSVLLGLLTSMYGTVRIGSASVPVTVLGSAFLFGLWHILPALEMHDSHSLTSQLGSGWGAKLATVLVRPSWPRVERESSSPCWSWSVEASWPRWACTGP